jgi:hypothetical protein
LSTEAEYLGEFTNLRSQPFWKGWNNDKLRLIAAMALVSGGGGGGGTSDASAALQSAGNVSLGSIDTKLNSLATSALQSAGNISLGSIDTKLNSLATSALQSAGNVSLGSIDANLINGNLKTQIIDTARATYAACINLTLVPTANDVFGIIGSATRTIKITRFSVNIQGTSVTRALIFLVKRAVLAAGGTLVAVPASRLDSANPPATATVNFYSANPTAAVGFNIRQTRILVPLVTSLVDEAQEEFRFGDGTMQPVVLRGVNESLWLNMGGVTPTGGNLTAYIEWTEE